MSAADACGRERRAGSGGGGGGGVESSTVRERERGELSFPGLEEPEWRRPG